MPVEDAGRENKIGKVKSCHVAAYLNSIFLCLIPVDSLIARGDYEDEFTLHEFTILPAAPHRNSKTRIR